MVSGLGKGKFRIQFDKFRFKSGPSVTTSTRGGVDIYIYSQNS